MGWTQAAAIRRFELAVTALGEQPPATASLKRMFAYWESGERTVTFPVYQQAFAGIYQASPRDLGFGPPDRIDGIEPAIPHDVEHPAGSRSRITSSDSPRQLAENSINANVTVSAVVLDDQSQEESRQVKKAAGWWHQVGGLGRWPVWLLPRGLRWYVFVVVGLWVAVAGHAVVNLQIRSDDLLLFALLIGCCLISTESDRKFGAAADRVWRDMLGVWTLPLMLLLPPAYSLLAPVLLQTLAQLRVRRSLPHRLAFNIAANGLPSGLGSWVFHTLAGTPGQDSPESPGAASQWVAIGLAAAALRVAVNLFMVAAAVKASDPDASWRSLLFSRYGLVLEGVQTSAGLTVTALCLSSPWLAPLVLPAALFGNRAAMALQVRALAETDAKTGLLSAGTWEREANVAVARAHRQQTPLAVLHIDLDHFKQINDRHGDLIGDLVLRAVADKLRAHLRPGDLIGRFGGEGFAVLLPGVDQPEARSIAERLRQQIDTLAIPINVDAIGATSATDVGDGIRVTVSIGVARGPARGPAAWRQKR